MEKLLAKLVFLVMLFAGICGCYASISRNSMGWEVPISRSDAAALLRSVQRATQGVASAACYPLVGSENDPELLALVASARAEDIIEFGTPPYIFEKDVIEVFVRVDGVHNMQLNIRIFTKDGRCEKYEINKVLVGG